MCVGFCVLLRHTPPNREVERKNGEELEETSYLNFKKERILPFWTTTEGRRVSRGVTRNIVKPSLQGRTDGSRSTTKTELERGGLIKRFFSKSRRKRMVPPTSASTLINPHPDHPLHPTLRGVLHLHHPHLLPSFLWEGNLYLYHLYLPHLLLHLLHDLLHRRVST